MYLGLDLGTSGLRAILVDGAGVIRASAERTYPVARPRAGWSEQNPDDWIAACRDAVAELRSAHPKLLPALKAVGLSGQMHGATLLGRDDAALRPCILWNDTRAHAEAAELDAIPAFRRISGNIVFPGFTAPKLAWVRNNEPDTFEKTVKVLLPKDYLRLWLTGGHVSDMSDSAGTSWLDVGRRAWSDELLAASRMRREQMPDLVEGSDVSGTLRRSLAAEWGVAGNVQVVGGGGDNAAAACGAGCFGEGQGFVSLGTSGVVLAARDSFSPNPQTAVHTFCHAIPGAWYQMGVILAATDCLNWLATNLGKSAAELSGLLDGGIHGPSPVRFLPYLSGERTPHNDSVIRGAFIGLDIATGHAKMTQAVMEGVAFALRDSLDALEGTGADLTRLLAIGGGSQSRFWAETLATVFGVPLDLPESGEFGAALGAARLAMAGHTATPPADIMAPPPVAETIEPRPDLAAAYQDAYAQYRALYPAIKAIT